MRHPRVLLLITAVLAVSGPARAVDYATAVFGTVGYARSDHPFVYQRNIDDNGGFNRDRQNGGFNRGPRPEGGFRKPAEKKEGGAQ